MIDTLSFTLKIRFGLVFILEDVYKDCKVSGLSLA